MEKAKEKQKFRVLGMVTNASFQKCKTYVQRLYKSYPKEYDPPDIHPMLNLEWTEYLRNTQRDLGGRLWEVQKPVLVFHNGDYLGNDHDLHKYITRYYKYAVVRDFAQQGQEHLMDIMEREHKKGRRYVYLTIAIENHVVGSLLFLLYADLVPETCNLFLRRLQKEKGGYINSPVHRIAKTSWIQCGGFKIKPVQIPCENYIIPHDRRGVLSMCNSKRHRNNSMQFNIALAATAWMDCRYVAFGQLLQGEEILSLIENLPTNYQSPMKDVRIVKTGEYVVCEKPNEDDVQELERFLEIGPDFREDMLDLRYVASDMQQLKYKRGYYFHCSDLKSHMPFLHLPDYLMYLMRTAAEQVEEECPDDKNVRNYVSPAIPETVSSTSLLSITSIEKQVRRLLKSCIADASNDKENRSELQI